MRVLNVKNCQKIGYSPEYRRVKRTQTGCVIVARVNFLSPKFRGEKSLFVIDLKYFRQALGKESRASFPPPGPPGASREKRRCLPRHPSASAATEFMVMIGWRIDTLWAGRDRSRPAQSVSIRQPIMTMNSVAADAEGCRGRHLRFSREAPGGPGGGNEARLSLPRACRKYFKSITNNDFSPRNFGDRKFTRATITHPV